MKHYWYLSMMAQCEQPDYTIIPEHVFRTHILPHFHETFQISVKKCRSHCLIKYQHRNGWNITFYIMQVFDRWILDYIDYRCYEGITVWKVGSEFILLAGKEQSSEIFKCIKVIWDTVEGTLRGFDPQKAMYWLDTLLLKPLVRCEHAIAKK